MAGAGRHACGWVTHELFFWHDSGLESYNRHVQPHGSNESAESKRRFANLVAVAGDGVLAKALVQNTYPREATDEELLRIHTPAHVARVKQISAQPEARKKKKKKKK